MGYQNCYFPKYEPWQLKKVQFNSNIFPTKKNSRENDKFIKNSLNNQFGFLIINNLTIILSS